MQPLSNLPARHLSGRAPVEYGVQPVGDSQDGAVEFGPDGLLDQPVGDLLRLGSGKRFDGPWMVEGDDGHDGRRW